MKYFTLVSLVILFTHVSMISAAETGTTGTASVTQSAQVCQTRTKLGYNKQILIKPLKLYVKFIDVKNSICPEGARCIRAGEITASIKVTRKSRNKTIRLSKPASYGFSDRAEVFGQKIVLLDIKRPARNPRSTSSKNAYIAVLCFP